MWHIGILEDNDRRLTEMLTTLHELIPESVATCYPDAHEFIEWLNSNISTLALLCLDHDLVPPESSPKHDPGDGRDVVRWLVGQSIQIPVLIHTSNGRAGIQMETTLLDAGWKAYWTPPDNDLAWIRKAWIQRVREMLLRERET